jgi:TPR repeat protein
MRLLRISSYMMLVLLISACATTNRSISDRGLLEAGADAYERGDYAEAFRQLKPLAERGDALAQTKLGNMYYLGLGVLEDDGEAARWFSMAANQGDPEAQVMLGTLYVLGTGVPQDYAEAARLFRMPAELGIGGAQFLLGMLYMNGNGVQEDSVQAYMWMELAVERGSKGAREARRILAEQMTPEQIARAEAMAKAWKPSRGIKSE